MPTILRVGAYRFFFYAGDRNEPVHVHVERDSNIAKFWLNPVRLQNSGGFNRKELSTIQMLILKHQKEMFEAWHEYFGE
jgi:hypothetical protein